MSSTKVKPRWERKDNDDNLEWYEDESSEEEKKKEVTNMCFMAIDELDEVNSNISYEDIHDAFEELYEDFEKCFSQKESSTIWKRPWISKRKIFKCWRF